MADVWLGRFNRYAEKLFNIKGGPALVDLSPSVTPVLQLANPPFEDRYLVGIESFGGGSTVAAVAGNKSACMIRNPLGSNVIVIIEKISIATAAAENLNLDVAGSNPADLATPITNSSRADPRTRSVGSAILSQAAPAVDPNTGFLTIGVFSPLQNVQTDLIQTVNQEIVLLPQIALRVVGQLVNTNLVWTIWWRERPLETSELA